MRHLSTIFLITVGIGHRLTRTTVSPPTSSSFINAHQRDLWVVAPYKCKWSWSWSNSLQERVQRNTFHRNCSRWLFRLPILTKERSQSVLEPIHEHEWKQTSAADPEQRLSLVIYDAFELASFLISCNIVSAAAASVHNLFNDRCVCRSNYNIWY